MIVVEARTDWKSPHMGENWSAGAEACFLQALLANVTKFLLLNQRFALNQPSQE